MSQEELLKKCEDMDDPSVMGACRIMLETMAEKEEQVEDESPQTYLEMASSLKPQDLPKVLELALKVRESEDIKDPEVKTAASRLIRAIEMS